MHINRVAYTKSVSWKHILLACTGKRIGSVSLFPSSSLLLAVAGRKGRKGDDPLPFLLLPPPPFPDQPTTMIVIGLGDKSDNRTTRWSEFPWLGFGSDIISGREKVMILDLNIYIVS